MQHHVYHTNLIELALEILVESSRNTWLTLESPSSSCSWITLKLQLLLEETVVLRLGICLGYIFGLNNRCCDVRMSVGHSLMVEGVEGHHCCCWEAMIEARDEYLKNLKIWFLKRNKHFHHLSMWDKVIPIIKGELLPGLSFALIFHQFISLIFSSTYESPSSWPELRREMRNKRHDCKSLYNTW